MKNYGAWVNPDGKWFEVKESHYVWYIENPNTSGLETWVENNIQDWKLLRKTELYNAVVPIYGERMLHHGWIRIAYPDSIESLALTPVTVAVILKLARLLDAPGQLYVDIADISHIVPVDIRNRPDIVRLRKGSSNLGLKCVKNMDV